MEEEESRAINDAHEADLLQQVDALKLELLEMQQGQAIIEGALKKKKAKAEQEVEVGCSLAIEVAPGIYEAPVTGAVRPFFADVDVVFQQLLCMLSQQKFRGQVGLHTTHLYELKQ